MMKSLAVVAGCILLAGCSSDPGQSSECVGETGAALKTCAGTTTLKGVDVSYYQGTVNWTSVKSSGHAFAFARASDGVNYPDTKFAANWPAMKNAGVIRGVYQFFRPGQDVQDQVDLLFSKLNAAGGLDAGDLPPVLDLETTDNVASSTVVARAKSWLQKVEAKSGVKPIVYTAAFMSSVIGTSFSGYTVWVANYGVTCPTMPSGWTDWHFWQNADNGAVPGISGGVDTDIFNGDIAALKKITIQPANAPPKGTGTTAPSADDDIFHGAQGATLGSSKDQPPSEDTTGATVTEQPCSR